MKIKSNVRAGVQAQKQSSKSLSNAVFSSAPVNRCAGI